MPKFNDDDEVRGWVNRDSEGRKTTSNRHTPDSKTTPEPRSQYYRCPTCKMIMWKRDRGKHVREVHGIRPSRARSRAALAMVVACVAIAALLTFQPALLGGASGAADHESSATPSASLVSVSFSTVTQRETMIATTTVTAAAASNNSSSAITTSSPSRQTTGLSFDSTSTYPFCADLYGNISILAANYTVGPTGGNLSVVIRNTGSPILLNSLSMSTLDRDGGSMYVLQVVGTGQTARINETDYQLPYDGYPTYVNLLFMYSETPSGSVAEGSCPLTVTITPSSTLMP